MCNSLYTWKYLQSVLYKFTYTVKDKTTATQFSVRHLCFKTSKECHHPEVIVDIRVWFLCTQWESATKYLHRLSLAQVFLQLPDTWLVLSVLALVLQTTYTRWDMHCARQPYACSTVLSISYWSICVNRSSNIVRYWWCSEAHRSSGTVTSDYGSLIMIDWLINLNRTDVILIWNSCIDSDCLSLTIIDQHFQKKNSYCQTVH